MWKKPSKAAPDRDAPLPKRMATAASTNFADEFSPASPSPSSEDIKPTSMASGYSVDDYSPASPTPIADSVVNEHSPASPSYGAEDNKSECMSAADTTSWTGTSASLGHTVKMEGKTFANLNSVRGSVSALLLFSYGFETPLE
jgi:hypothetical protein